MPDPARDRQAFAAWQTELREQLREALGIPTARVPLEPQSRGQIEHEGLIIEKWVFTTEPGSLVPALLVNESERVPLPSASAMTVLVVPKSKPSACAICAAFQKRSVM